MINKITVLENRQLKITSKKFGVVGENNAEILQFEFPERIDGYSTKSCQKKVKFVNEDGANVINIYETENNQIEVNSSWTSQQYGTIWVEITSPKNTIPEMLWKSYPYDIKFVKTPDDSKLPQGEQIKIELTNNVILSFKQNVDLNVATDSTFEQLIGTDGNDYKDSLLYKLRRDLHIMTSRNAGTFTTGEPFTIASNIKILDDFLTEANKKICEVINPIFGTPWVTLPWYYPDDENEKTVEFYIRNMEEEARFKSTKIISDALNELFGTDEYSKLPMDELADVILHIFDNFSTDIRNSLALNSGYDISESATVSSLIGTSANNYTDSEMYRIRQNIIQICEQLSKDTYDGDIKTTITSLKNYFDSANASITEVINEQFGKSEPSYKWYDDDESVESIAYFIKRMPDKVIEKCNTLLADSLTNTLTDNDWVYDETKHAWKSNTPGVGALLNINTDTFVHTVESIADVVSILSDNLKPMASIVDWVESFTARPPFTILGQLGSAEHPVAFPYFKTDNAIYRIDFALPFSNISEIGFDVSQTEAFNTSEFKNTYPNSKLFITGLDRAKVNNPMSTTSPYKIFADSKLKEIYFDRMSVLTTTDAKSMASLFENCQNLEILGGFNKETRSIDNTTLLGDGTPKFGVIDYTGLSSAYNMFYNCPNLKEFRLAPNSAAVQIWAQQSPLLSQKTMLSVINALRPDASSSNRVINLASAVKTNMSTWKCKLNANTNLYEISNDPTAVSFASAVTMKGWSMK